VEETLRYLGVALGAERLEAAIKKSSGHKDAGKPAARKPAAAAAVMMVEEAQDNAVLDGENVNVPDFTGMSIAQALNAARKSGVAVLVEGSGRAVSQSLEPGVSVRGAPCRVAFQSSPPLVMAEAKPAAAKARRAVH
jgi:hypothetical protein